MVTMIETSPPTSASGAVDRVKGLRSFTGKYRILHLTWFAFFLSFVVGLVEQTVGEAARSWAATRRQQIDDGQLVYIAHQVDCLATKR